MSRPKAITVSITPSGEGVNVWNASFHLNVPLKRHPDGRVDESARAKLQALIKKTLEIVDFSEE